MVAHSPAWCAGGKATMVIAVNPTRTQRRATCSWAPRHAWSSTTARTSGSTDELPGSLSGAIRPPSDLSSWHRPQPGQQLPCGPWRPYARPMETSDTRVRVVVADDHPFYRDGLTRGLT